MGTFNQSYVVINSDYTSIDYSGYRYSYPFVVTNTGKKVSVGNPGYRNPGRSNGDVGSGFLMERNHYSSGMGRSHFKGSGKQEWYGIQLPIAPTGAQMLNGMSLPPFDAAAEAALRAKGTTAIAQTLPTNPTSGVLQFAGELYRDGLPRIVGSGLLKSRLKDYREYGSEYLNVEFGWKPFISDFKRMLYSVRESEKILNTFRQESSQLLHRRYSFPSQSETVLDGPYLNAGPWPSWSLDSWAFGGVTCKGTLILETTKSVDTWFEGAYRYYLPVGDSLMDRYTRFSAEAGKLLGLRLTPEVLWDLTPWTWLGDWVSNMGDVVHNLSALNNDNLVMKYGYIMSHSKNERRAMLSLNRPRLDGVSMYDLSYTVERKARSKATPYGFSLTWDGFTPRQWAILGAIGISNSRKTSS